MKRVVFDIETDGLLHQLTKMHSLVIRDADTGELLLSCTDDPRGLEMGYRPNAEGLSLLSEADVLYAHNGQAFDVPAIQKLYPEWTFRGELIDTVLVTAFRFAHQKELDYERNRRGKQKPLPNSLVGRHSLEAWGHRLGLQKGDYSAEMKAKGLDPWAEWNPAMQEYCELDTEVNYAIVERLRKAKGLPKLALEIEHKLARYLRQQEENGWPFDAEKAYELFATLAARREELADMLREKYGFWFQAAGEVTPKRSMRRSNPVTGVKEQVVAGAAYSKVKQIEFNPGSRQHIARCLIRHHRWKPKVFTPSGQPQIDEKALKGLKADIAPTLLEFLMVEKRLGQIANGKKAWLKLMTNAKPGGGQLTGMIHLHHWVKQNEAVTHRAAHADPNLAQVPKVGKPHGAECRDLFTVPKGWVMLGADASGLELRCLAHYMAKYDGGEYVRVILEGDIHSVNQDAAGLPTRDDAKAFIYAYLYGAGNAKLGTIVLKKGSKQARAQIGAKLRRQFEKRIPALGKLVAQVGSKVGKPGYVKMPDGRRTYIRHAHAALNSLLQGAGAIICKLWIVRFSEKLEARFGPQGWDGKWAALGWIHDEVQLAVRPEIAEEVGQILVETIREVGIELGWRCPLDGEAKIGRTWKDTH